MSDSTTTTPVETLGPWRSERQGAEHAQESSSGSRWVPVGTRSSGVLAAVDPAGLVGRPGQGWAVDWWIGAEDRWYLPAREAAVRQSLVEESPVVETRQRVPGGDIRHRVHAAQGSAALGDREAIVIELVNETPVPVAVALAVRPYGVDGGSGIHRIENTTGGALIDGSWTLFTDRSPRMAAASADGVDPVAIVTGGDAAPTWSTIDAADGHASLALVFPLPHTATMRVALVAGAGPSDPGGVLAGLPDGDAVAAGWARQADHGLQAVLPDAVLTSALDGVRRRLMLVAPDITSMSSGADQAVVGRALSALGHPGELRAVVGDLLEGQRLTGAFVDRSGHESATGAALSLIGSWWREDPRPELLDELVGPLAKAAHRLERRRSTRRHRKDPKRRGLLPAGPQPAELGPRCMTYADGWWAAAGLAEAAAVLEAGGQTEAAVDAGRFGRDALEAVNASLVSVMDDLEVEAIPAGPDRALDEGVVGLLPALGVLGVLDGTTPSVARTVELIRTELVGPDGWVRAGAAGAMASPRLTACLALHEITSGDPRGLERLNGLLRVGGASLSWPRRLDDRGRGHGEAGDDPVAVALVALALRSLSFVEREQDEEDRPALDILPLVPDAWLGQGVELHDAPTRYGRFGYAVRWHGERPALLWELTPSKGIQPPRITASALAPGWSTAELVGETLLPAPTGVGAPVPDPVHGAASTPDDDVTFS